MRLLGVEILRRPKLAEMIKREISQYDNSNKYALSQIRRGESTNWSFTANYKDVQEIRTYKLMRNLVPFLDATVLKRTLLLGDFDVWGDDDASTEYLRNYKNTVKEGYFGNKWINYVYHLADSAYTTGIAVGERVNRADMGGTAQLLVGDPEVLRFIRDDEVGYILGYQQPSMIDPVPFDNPDNIHYLAFNRKYGNPRGVSMFQSLEFAVQLHTKIMQALHNNVWRIGDPIFISVVKGEVTDTYSHTGPASVSGGFRTQLSETLKTRSKGQTGDIHVYMPGDYEFEVKALGVDGFPVFDFTLNSRIVIEQLLSTSHLPQHAFPLYNWNSNYRMSQDQQRLLITVIDADRSKIDAIIGRDFEMELFAAGIRSKVYWEWHDVDLTELVDKARSGLMEAQARKADIETLVNMLWMNGLIDDNTLTSKLEEYGIFDDESEKQKVLDSLGNIRKMALLKNVSQNVLRRQTLKALKVA
jgi:hypothetical protein